MVEYKVAYALGSRRVRRLLIVLDNGVIEKVYYVAGSGKVVELALIRGCCPIVDCHLVRKARMLFSDLMKIRNMIIEKYGRNVFNLIKKKAFTRKCKKNPSPICEYKRIMEAAGVKEYDTELEKLIIRYWVTWTKYRALMRRITVVDKYGIDWRVVVNVCKLTDTATVEDAIKTLKIVGFDDLNVLL